MSLTVIKPGILDTVQDGGRYGYQYLGVNPGGAMDRYSAQVVNMLVGNKLNEAVIEMHFPAAAFLFQQETIIAIGGADFVPCINGEEVPLLHPIVISRNSILQFQNIKYGAQCYLAVRGGFDLQQWLGSYSTHLKAETGGYKGRALQKDDVIHFRKQECCKRYLSEKEYSVLPWKADTRWNSTEPGRIAIIRGREWEWLSGNVQTVFENNTFYIAAASDRMGYRLGSLSITADASLLNSKKQEIISSAVNFGTIQLLPNGQLIVLMADHQTAGGYPRIAHVVYAHLPQLAQYRPGDKFNFYTVDVDTAEQLQMNQKQHLIQLEHACSYKLEQFLKN